MINLAIFVSGRLIGYKDCFIESLNRIQNRSNYKIYLFFSINTFSFDKDSDAESVLNQLKLDTPNDITIATINFEEFKMPKSYVMNRINNDNYNFGYNQLACYYNDFKNFQLIENYSLEYGIEFDIVCKFRSEIIIKNNFTFIIDDKDDLIIRHKPVWDGYYWGHDYKHTIPMFVGDTAYGNLKSMKLYCSTYNWILEKDLLFNGYYMQGFEVFLTDSILQNVFYRIPGGENIPLLTKEQIIDKYTNNPNKIKIILIDNFQHDLLAPHIRSKNNFTVDINNVFDYTKAE
jgi:hypothetical protein